MKTATATTKKHMHTYLHWNLPENIWKVIFNGKKQRKEDVIEITKQKEIVVQQKNSLKYRICKEKLTFRKQKKENPRLTITLKRKCLQKIQHFCSIS